MNHIPRPPRQLDDASVTLSLISSEQGGLSLRICSGSRLYGHTATVGHVAVNIARVAMECVAAKQGAPVMKALLPYGRQQTPLSLPHSMRFQGEVVS
jgi:hypothetical protein